MANANAISSDAIRAQIDQINSRSSMPQGNIRYDAPQNMMGSSLQLNPDSDINQA